MWVLLHKSSKLHWMLEGNEIFLINVLIHKANPYIDIKKSSNIIIPRTEYPPDHCTRTDLFNPSRSSTYKNNSTPMDVGSNMDYNLPGYWGK
jgi:hypothetical protein